ncbi:MAG: pyridoxamine 5'-phosphate oxidase family protein [Pyrinomonadaceae bacterium]|nr:pyridoxamine 5'-phosphate oxidase family protein [Pyrinomonadaceae bacterium]
MTEQGIKQAKNDEMKKIGEFIKDIDFTMMTTINSNGELEARPMSTQKTEFNGEVYFFTFEDTEKVAQIKANPKINLAYSDTDNNTYVSIKGTARISKDRAKMEELWSPPLKAWFPDGLETDGLALIVVTADAAEYWDSTSSVIAQALGMAKAVITGESYDYGENKTVDLS